MIRLADDINLNAEDPARGMVARRRAIIDAAEMVVIQGVFTPEQADAYQGLLWKVKGFEALLEPQVAERLGLSRRQRQELSRRIAERRSGSETATAALGGLLKSTVPGEGPNALNMMKSSADDLERRVWAVLTPAQLGKWESLTRSKPEVLSRRRN